MENDRRASSSEPLIYFMIDELAKEALDAGFTGKEVDGYISLAIEKSGQEILKEITERHFPESPATDISQNENPNKLT